NCMLPLAHLHESALHDRVERSLMADPVAALGPREPVTVPDAATLGEAIRLMIDRGVGAVLVTAPDGRLVGILTERDFLAKAAGRARVAPGAGGVLGGRGGGSATARGEAAPGRRCASAPATHTLAPRPGTEAGTVAAPGRPFRTVNCFDRGRKIRGWSEKHS